MKILSLVVLFCLYVIGVQGQYTSSGARQCYRSGKYYDPGQSWVDSSCTYRCNCYSGGRYKCVSLCYSQFPDITCGHLQTKKYSKATVPGSNCQCDKPYCTAKPKQQDVCYGNGKRYTVGQSYIDAACKFKCTCNRGGRVSCVSVCSSYSARCASHQILKYTKIAVPGSSCQCRKPKCIAKPPSVVKCYRSGKYYNPGQSWVDSSCTYRCNCYSGGRYKCVSLCSSQFPDITCGHLQTKKYSKATVPGSNCQCDKPYCTAKPKPQAVQCNFRGSYFGVGQSFVDSSCKWSCKCNPGGIYNCLSACVYISKRCPPYQKVSIKEVPVPGSNVCKCKVPSCVNRYGK